MTGQPLNKGGIIIKNYSDGLYSWCKECANNYPNKKESDKRIGWENRQKFNEYKKTLKCIICGYDEIPGKLEFHHRDPITKLFDVSVRSHWGLHNKRMLKEMAKCDVLCRPCHADHHRIENKYK